MSVFVSSKHLYVQFINDLEATTIASASTQAGEAKSSKGNVDAARKLGQVAAEAAKGKGISEVVFDRGGFAYRGRIKALAEAAREAGLKF